MDEAAEQPASAPSARIIARGEGWCVSDVTCRLGPRDRAFEERHECVTVAAVIAGTFRYRASTGTALLYPGAFLLGNAGTCFECGHEHSTGDRCVAFQFAPALFEEVASGITGTNCFRFPAAMLPPRRQLTAPMVKAEISAHLPDVMAMEEDALRLMGHVLDAFSESEPQARLRARDERRINDVIRHMETSFDQPLGLADLARMASMSKYHFLRCFRQVAGVTPYQFLLDLRLRRAAVRLATTAEAVAGIAFDAGFGDLSTFNGRFRDVFGLSPSRFRATHTKRAAA